MATREKWGKGAFEAFKLGALPEEAQTRLNLTQEELTERCGTNKASISRIEANASDIRLCYPAMHYSARVGRTIAADVRGVRRAPRLEVISRVGS